MTQLQPTEWFVHAILGILDQGESEGINPNDRTAWTDYVARQMSRLAEPYSSEVQVWGPLWREENRGSYILDQAWARIRNDDWSEYRGLALGFECEWNKDEDSLFQDFCKVVDVAAERRLFLGQLQARAWDKRAGVIDRAERIVRNHPFLRATDEVGFVICNGGREGGLETWVLHKGEPRTQV